MRESKSKNNALVLLIYLILTIWAVASLFPLYWLLTSSFKPAESIIGYPPEWIPQKATLSNYRSIFQHSEIIKWTLNTALVSVVIITTSIFFSSLAAYVFAKKIFPGGRILFSIVLSIFMVPLYILTIPLYLLISELKLLDTYAGIVLPWMTGPFGIFLLRGFIQTIPSELIDAAKIDGCSEFGIYWRIILPLIKPALAVFTITCLQFSWNTLLWPLIITGPKTRTLSVGLTMLMMSGRYSIAYGDLMAGASYMIIPMIFFFFFLQRYLSSGIVIRPLK